MAPIKKGILILSPFYSPNIGGVETHLQDLTSELVKQKYQVYVLTYSPITTYDTSYKHIEKNKYIYIRRYRWLGRNLFHTLERFPFFDFIYLTPYLLVRSFLWMIFNQQKTDIIHSHGINAAFIGNILAFIFNKKHITSTHTIYDHLHGISQHFATATLNHTDHILCLSLASQEQLLSWGVSSSKISLYRYWIDLQRFSPATTKPTKFTLIFVGRLIAKKGILLYLKLAKKFPQFNFLVVGTGPQLNQVKQYCSVFRNIHYLGTNPVYQQSSVLCVPSLYREGYGRVAMEATACGIPVIASNLGGLREALNPTVAILVKPTLNNFVKSITQIIKPKVYSTLKHNCRPYAIKNFSPKNINQITKFY